MKNFIAFTAILTVLISCGRSSDKGELVGVKGAKWHPEKPYGMTLVPGGSYIMGKSDDDVANVADAPTKTVTVRAFYMDETEITNSEYRQFVEWVKDSTIRFRLAILAEDSGQGAASDGKGKNTGSIADYSFSNNNSDPEKMTAYDKYMYDNYYSIGTDKDPNAYKRLDRKAKLVKDVKKYPDEYYTEVMDSMYLPLEASYNGLRTIDVNKLKFRYTWMDIQAAAKAKVGKRQDFIRTEEVKVYPDTTVWIKDFAYSYNEPMHNDYFWHKAYGEYPVVGVTWSQAKAFCEWRTLNKNSYLKSKKNHVDNVNSFRLPTEAEWEYAARGGLESATFPWGGPYTKSDRGCFLANFKPNRGDYAADQALYTVEAKSYETNGYNLYNMAGNVSEWTDSAYDANSYDFVSTMNPAVIDNSNKRKVVRGGSWKDVAYFLQVSTRAFEYSDSARSYIGFRTVQDYMGTQTTGNNKRK
ncbi:gliding motility lipoprotein GldK [Flavobacterium granuli]|uniref:Gliding motility-associated lipoprotein GldK n=1 Tax=Flavobacterium granuli TaxID=280093 RepID=A0ABU1RYY7_9FLAO|nr:gliding motility lipoprotein GldK [Flavobacterium granuli]MDR6843977.1 gliding motility-associated lipoprotein GldK [Flavobacterium granuli]